jgi:thioredoxin 1
MLNSNVSADELDVLVAQNDVVLVDFWTKWCAPCKEFSAVFERIANENQNLVFAKVNLEKESVLAEKFQIRSIPHLLIFKQGIVVYSESGSMPDSALKELVEQALTVDVSAIRAKIDSGEI